MKLFRLNALASDVFISVYVILTLFLRFLFETTNNVGAVESLIMGFCFIVLLWVLIKSKILNPNWFGLFNQKNNLS